LFIRLLEYHVPKLRAAMVDVRDRTPRSVRHMSTAELKAIVAGTDEPEQGLISAHPIAWADVGLRSGRTTAGVGAKRMWRARWRSMSWRTRTIPIELPDARILYFGCALPNGDVQNY